MHNGYKITRGTKILFAIAAGCVLIGAYWLMNSRVHAVQFDAEGRIVFAKEKSYWIGRIARVGGHEAYREFGISAVGLTPKRAHIAAHVFGESLYEIEGFDSISVCDAKYAMGCSHAFFGSAAINLGIDSFLKKAGEACANKSTRGLERLCLHGAGHGIIGMVGYEVDDLQRALDLCETMPDVGNLTTGCWGGAFMEHNVRTLVSLDVPERPLTDAGAAYAPCDALPEEYMGPCMFWQPTWWDVALSRHDDQRSVYARIGALCAAHPDQSLAEWCIKGAGFRAAWISAYEPRTTAELCSEMGSPDARGICWNSAITELPRASARAAAPLVCDGLDDADKAACIGGI